MTVCGQTIYRPLSSQLNALGMDVIEAGCAAMGQAAAEAVD